MAELFRLLTATTSPTEITIQQSNTFSNKNVIWLMNELEYLMSVESASMRGRSCGYPRQNVRRNNGGWPR